jgi:mycofactocin system glycosyltransferase
VIPLRYRLREGVRVEPGPDGSWRVVSLSPLYVVRINAAAAELLRRTRQGARVNELAAAFRVSEERVFGLCERFRARGILEVAPPIADGAEATSGLPYGERSSEDKPRVSVVIPALDRAAELEECLRSLRALDYPADHLEVLVVDDGSARPAEVAAVAARYGARLLVNDRNRGPAYSRNRAAAASKGELLAFIDSDCVAERSWLARLVPYFAWDKVGAVGGRTVGYYADSALDRYEEVSSPLDMGPWLHIEGPGPDTFYVPTCNLVVRRSVFAALGGLRADLRLGEDVDFCWRLRARGHYLVYAPEGVVRHKHRDRLVAMLRRRAQYGTSEAVLYALHPDKRKRLPLLPAPLATVALVVCTTLGLTPRLLPAVAGPLLWDGLRRTAHLRREGLQVPTSRVWTAVARTHLGMLYVTYFHLQRYYLWLLAALGAVLPGAWALAASAVVYSAGVDYAARRPRLGFPTFLAYYAAEHLAYQTGVIVGCTRAKSLRSYLLCFNSAIGAGAAPGTRTSER